MSSATLSLTPDLRRGPGVLAAGAEMCSKLLLVFQLRQLSMSDSWELLSAEVFSCAASRSRQMSSWCSVGRSRRSARSSSSSSAAMLLHPAGGDEAAGAVADLAARSCWSEVALQPESL